MKERLSALNTRHTNRKKFGGKRQTAPTQQYFQKFVSAASGQWGFWVFGGGQKWGESCRQGWEKVEYQLGREAARRKSSLRGGKALWEEKERRDSENPRGRKSPRPSRLFKTGEKKVSQLQEKEQRRGAE